MQLTEVVSEEGSSESLIRVCLRMNWRGSLETGLILDFLKIFATNRIVARR